MNDAPLALIGARLQRPVAPPALWPRPRLQAQLDAICAHRLTRMVAPAGFGKSLALALWAAHAAEAGTRVGWLRLESGECSPRLLGAYLEAALAAPPRGRPGKALLGRAAGGDVHGVLARLLDLLVDEDQAVPRSRVLVIDDAHWLEPEPASLELLRRLLREAPAGFHLVLAGRHVVLPVPAELQASAQVLDLGVDVLRITDQEWPGFAQAVLGLPCPGDTLAWCARLSGGWPLPALLILRQLRAPWDVDGARARRPAMLSDLAAFLEGEVLAGLPARLVEFLLLVAVADPVEAGLAEAMTDGEDAAEWLDRLLVGGLAAPDPQHPGWLRLEPALRQWLCERLQRERPGHAALLHGRAAHWYAGCGDWDAAIAHALQAGDASRAAQWIEAQGEVLLGRGRFRPLLDWIAALPEETRLARPRLQLLQAWALTFLHRRDEAEEVLAGLARQRQEAEREALAVQAVMSALEDDSRRAQALGEQVLGLAPLPGSLADHAGHTAVIFGLAAASRFEQVEMLRTRQPALRGFDSLAALYRQNLFAFSAFQAGRLDPAGLMFEEVMARARDAGAEAEQPAAMAASYLAAIHYERDDPEQARSLLAGRRRVAGEGASLGALLHCLRTEARLADLAGHPEQALEILDEGCVLGSRRGQLRLQAGCLGEWVRMQLARGQLLEADRTLRRLLSLGIRAPEQRTGIAAETWDDVRLAEGRALVASRAPRRAVPILRSLWQDLSAAGRDYLAARAAVVLVRALEAAGDPEGALEPLWQALRYGQLNGLVRTFADEGAALAGPIARLLLAGVPAGDVDPEYLCRLRRALDPSGALSGLGAPEGAARPAAQPIDPAPRLSARETEILQYMARGLSNKQIARALGLSPETVKWYLKQIYEKLQVSGRVQAIQAGLGIRVAAAEADGESA